MNRIKNYWFIGLFFASVEVFCPIYAHGALKKDNIQKLNNALIFDLFMNYELSERNGNLSAIIDYIPNFSSTLFKSIKTESNMGGKNEVCNFEFTEKGFLKLLSYQVNDIIYTYELNYEKNQLESVSIAGNKKITIIYDKKGKLQTITRVLAGRSFEYYFHYLEDVNKAMIKTSVIQDGKKIPNPEKYFVSWNEQFKLSAFYLDVYSAKNIQYSKEDNLMSFSFNSGNADNKNAGWEYTFDDKGNWTERKFNKFVCKRTIEYK